MVAGRPDVRESGIWEGDELNGISERGGLRRNLVKNWRMAIDREMRGEGRRVREMGPGKGVLGVGESNWEIQMKIQDWEGE